MLAPFPGSDLGQLVSNIVSAYVANHTVDAVEVPALIRAVQNSFATLSATPAEAEAQAPQPAVPIKKSVFPDYIVCLEDGKKLKMLKRHLKTAYNMEPDEYRAKWGLPPSYPIVAPNYALHRSSLAKKSGLGTTSRFIADNGESGAQKIKPGRRGAKA